MTKLKPCPFCGAEAQSKDAKNVLFAIMCSAPNCNITGPIKETKAEAIDSWNTRTK